MTTMNVLESTENMELAAMLYGLGRHLDISGKFDNRPTWDNKTGGGGFDNRPTWDNK